MGRVEEKIKEDLLSEMFGNTFKIYELIDLRFSLSEEERQDVIAKINRFNDELTQTLKGIKLA